MARRRTQKPTGPRLNGADILTLTAPSVDAPLARAEFALGAGAAPVSWWLRRRDGSEFNLLGPRSIADLEQLYQARANSDPFASNLFFQPGVAAPLFPLANRLRGDAISADVATTEVLGRKMMIPLNHGRNAGQTRHHLHGLVFMKRFQVLTQDASRFQAYLDAGFFGPYWSGQVDVTIDQQLTARGFEFRMRACNLGPTPVPVGGGAHPYFFAPSGARDAIEIRIPGRQLVEIDNYDNVLPTGRVLPLTPEFDFSHARGLGDQHFDNLWIDLETDEDGYAFTEFRDTREGLCLRMTALTKNVIGIQCFTPVKSPLGPFVALEFVTNLPDPRRALWGERPTGLQLLEPDQTFEYGYRLEIHYD